MPNGSGLRGGPSASNNALILPHPSRTNLADPKLFYVFCIGDQSSNIWPEDSALTMSHVDYTADPAGEVTQKNIEIRTGLAEKLVATHHCDGETYWIVVHERSQPVFYAYRLTKDGLQPPVISRVGEQYKPPAPGTVLGGAYGQGLLAFSIDGRRLAMAVPFSYRTELFDFDNFTGQITSARVLDSTSRAYGVCFSPSGDLLYSVEWVSRVEDPVVRQFDLVAKMPPVNLGTLRDNGLDHQLGGIQLGPDGRIWLAESNGVVSIAQPDVPGPACGFRRDRISLSAPARIVVGLPNLVTSAYGLAKRDACAPPICAVASDTVLCAGDCLTVNDLTKNKPTTWSWMFEGGLPASFTGPQPPTICYPAPGKYKITLVATNQFGADTAYRFVRVAAPPVVSAGSDITLCDSAAGQLQASGAVRYEWEYKQGIGNTLSANPVVRVFEHTQFVVRGWNADGCSATDTVQVYSYPDGKARVILRVMPLAGTAGQQAVLTIVREAGQVASDFDAEVHLPAAAFMDAVVMLGTEVSRSRPTPAEYVLRIHPADIRADTLARIGATLLLFWGSEYVRVGGIPSDSCDAFSGIPGEFTSAACGAGMRMISFGSQALQVVSAADEGRAVTVTGNAEATVEVSAWTVEGGLLGRVETTLKSTTCVVMLPERLRGLVMYQIRSGEEHSERLLYIE
jgi:hypothetical protein